MGKRSICAMLDFLSPVSCIPGMGSKRIKALAESGIENVGEFLYNFPYRYIDRSEIVPLQKIRDFCGSTCTVKGKVISVRLEYGRKQRLKMHLKDESGTIELVWFRGIQYYSKGFKDTDVIVTGKIIYYSHFQMVHPIIEKISGNEKTPQLKFVPRYSITKTMQEAGIQQKLIIKAVSWCLK
ncbi:MAG TPA: OB-fold nucleic acid binding domain-containing protein, partial [Chitinispirillaceae bacterium]|nr:OB-fold nucleic acid binding domain-containing protein [Chitinispirillaceae bacterium]